MYASLADDAARIHTVYFVDLVAPEHGSRFLTDLHRWSASGPFRLLIVADDATETLSGPARADLELALATRPLLGAIERIAVSGPPAFEAETEALDRVLDAEVRHFCDDWHGAQTWLREPARTDA